MALNRVDLPTFGRPINATTGNIAFQIFTAEVRREAGSRVEEPAFRQAAARSPQE